MQKFKDIVHQYTPALYWHIRRIVISHEDAEDVLQDTFIKAYQRLCTLRKPEALKVWLFRIATNEALRTLSRKHLETDDIERLLDVEISESLSSASDDILGRNAEIKLHKAMAQMSPLQKTVFCLRYYDEMDYDEIAKICSSSAGSVKVIYHNAKEKVKSIIEA